MADLDRLWSLCYCRGLSLLREASALSLDDSVYLPVRSIRVYKRRLRKWVVESVPLWSGYAFVESDVVPLLLHRSKSLLGRVHSDGGDPLLLGSEDLRHVLHLASTIPSGAPAPDPTDLIPVGTAVKVTTGPLSNRTGTVVGHNNSGVRVRVDIIGGPIFTANYDPSSLIGASP